MTALIAAQRILNYSIGVQSVALAIVRVMQECYKSINRTRLLEGASVLIQIYAQECSRLKKREVFFMPNSQIQFSEELENWLAEHLLF